MLRLLTPADANPKTRKSDSARYLGAILHLAPAADGAPAGKTVCPMAERAGCAAPCLAFQGRARVFESIREARRRKTALYFADRDYFMGQLRHELRLLERRADARGLRATARLDGTSDLGFAERLHVQYPRIMFYDYTKILPRVRRLLRLRRQGLAPNWHLTYSAGAHTSQDEIEKTLLCGVNVAVPFDVKRGAPLPAEWRGWGVIDGDLLDDRFDDPRGVIVGLRAKGTSASIDNGAGFIRASEEK